MGTITMEDFWIFLVNALLFYLAYKVGQISVWVKSGLQQKEDIRVRLEEVRKTGIRPVITIEEINGAYYAYDGNDFLGQGTTPDELGRVIAQRFPNKYQLAKVEIKA
jgi:hypothetical protein